MIKHYLLVLGTAIMASYGIAADYSSLEGLCGAELKEAVKRIALPHTEISYGDATWKAFETADVRMINGREAWWDMYSNRLVWVATGHSGMNIEHCVANSWWGGERNAAYKDLHHLNPSDADANNRKSNNPLAPLAGTPTWSNGLSAVGTPAAGYGGGASVAFEPADEYKGDFARAYFYIFTVYDDISWQASPACMYELTAWPTLQPWAYSMLLDWAASDPVDEREASRNAAVAEVQKNENPFVAIPGLAEHIWGELSGVPLSLTDAMTPPVENRPDAPTFGDYTLAGVNTWTGRWWNGFDMTLSAREDATIYYSIGEDEPFEPYVDYVEIPAASAAGESLTLRAYCQTWLNGFPYRSSVSTLTLTAFEEGTTDYMHAEWERVASDSEINEEGVYIAVASKAFAVMGYETGHSSSSNYIKTPGNVDVVDDKITLLPEGTAVLKLEPAGGTEWYVEVNNLALEPQGYLWTDASKKCYISEEGMGVEVSLNSDANVEFNFGSSYGKLQYNAQSPRFSVYTSNQQPIDLYRCTSNLNVGTVSMPVDLMPVKEAPVWYTLDGRRLQGEPSAPGIYILRRDGKSIKVLR